MEVVLLESVPHLGHVGDICDVKVGYARNYLFPKQKALRATAENKKVFESQRSELEQKNAERRQEAEKLALILNGKNIQIITQAAQTGALYGSITARDIIDVLEKDNIVVKRQHVLLPHQIKSVGVHPVILHLHHGIEASIQIIVARSAEEAAWLSGEKIPKTSDLNVSAQEETNEEITSAEEGLA
jgi:large subunit ribosomal protein L9